MKKTLCVFTALTLLGCAESTTYAPVVDGNIERVPSLGNDRMHAHETLYSIAWRYGLDPRKLARNNHLPYPYHRQDGIALTLTTTSRASSSSSKADTDIPAPTPTIIHWTMPARGQVIATFSEVNKGIDIAGKLGDPIFTAAPGRVVYAGDGLKNYGNLIIIDHDGNFLTAYAHNDTLLVHEDDIVLPNQQIATLGQSGNSHLAVHFEIRLNGKPVNPLAYLPAQL